jgi:hypothetical protein
MKGDLLMDLELDFDTMSELDIYHALVPDGRECDALNGSYSELTTLIGCEATLKLFKYFRGCKIDCNKFFYKQEYIAELAVKTWDKRERAKLAIATGYTANRLETLVRKYKSDASTGPPKCGTN